MGEIHDLRSLPLQEIIGVPVSAVVEAETQAARTALEFIEQVGFVKDPDAPADASALSVGSLRMVEFGYQKADADGNPADFVARVPLLALLPLPGVRVKTAQIAFTAKITDVYSESTEPTQGTSTEPAFLSSPKMSFRGGLVSKSSTKETTTSSYDLNISIELEQTPLSPGMAKLLQVLDLAIQEAQKPPAK